MTWINADDLHIETDDAGFVLGTSLIGDQLGSEATVWLERRTQFSSLTMTRSVSVEKGVLFRPEAATLSLRMPGDALKAGAFGKKLRVRWKTDVIFVGSIKSTSYSSQATNDGPKTFMTINAVGMWADTTKNVAFDYARPQETAGIRANTLSPSLVVNAINCNRPMAARASSNIKWQTVLQETSDTQLARFYVSKDNVLTMDGDPADEPTILFSDDPAVVGRTDYRTVAMSEQLENTITAIGVQAKQDETLTATNRHPSAVVVHEETYEVDVPLNQTDVNAWAASFPLLGYVRPEPSSLTCAWQDSLIDLELTHLVSIQKEGETYRSGVKGISYDIKPTRDGGLKWNVALDLMPGHLVESHSVIAPSEPQKFMAAATTDHTIDLTWTPPALPNDMNGYEIRYNVGGTPPATRTEGTLLASVGSGVLGYTHTGATSNTQYSYALWAKTPTASVASNSVTAGATTPETIPGTATGLSAAKTATATHTLTWTAPTAPGTDIAGYELRARVDGINPTATTGSAVGFIAYGQTSYVANALLRNKVYSWGLFPKTHGGKYGQGVFASQNTNETTPGAVTGFNATAPAYNQLSLTWGASSSATDLDHYHVEYTTNGVPTTTRGGGTTLVNTSALSYAGPASMSTKYGLTIWPVTKGGIYGPYATDTVTTPQGIFSHVFDAGVAWTQSYRSDGQQSSLGSGSAQNLYYGYGDSFNGNQRAMAGWNVPANVVNCYKVDRVIMRIYNAHTYLNSGATCWFGSHTASAKPATYTGGSTGLATYTVAKGGWLEVDVTAWLGPKLKAGAKGILLGPPPSNSSNYYGYAAGTPGPTPSLRIEYRTLGS